MPGIRDAAWGHTAGREEGHQRKFTAIDRRGKPSYTRQGAELLQKVGGTLGPPTRLLLNNPSAVLTGRGCPS
ncbi:hypothetical protein AAFF_G00124180 [Aldrovandia affinis]|uniref:Uncharacterized protein n=1 Tax=Aldrovandia affinis TaxID=143900 RepID=A0AAD7W9M1_9TELE|nr:hypothetical protein AAFF_G00124180 [Aldrovandia affinis]